MVGGEGLMGICDELCYNLKCWHVYIIAGDISPPGSYFKLKLAILLSLMSQLDGKVYCRTFYKYTLSLIALFFCFFFGGGGGGGFSTLTFLTYCIRV